MGIPNEFENGLFGADDDILCDDVVDAAPLPDIEEPFDDFQAPESINEQPAESNDDCYGEAVPEESILDFQPAFNSESEVAEFDEECEEEPQPTTAAPAPQKDLPCYDENSDENSD